MKTKLPKNTIIGRAQINNTNTNLVIVNWFSGLYFPGIIIHAKIYAKVKLGMESSPMIKAKRMTLTSQWQKLANPDATPPIILLSVSRYKTFLVSIYYLKNQVSSNLFKIPLPYKAIIHTFHSFNKKERKRCQTNGHKHYLCSHLQ